MRKQHALSRKVPACRKEAASNMHTQTAWYTRFIYHNGQRLELNAVFSPVLSHVFQGLVTSYFYPLFFQASAFVMNSSDAGMGIVYGD